MMNIVTLVGVIQDIPTIREFESGVKGAFLTLRVMKPFKSVDGSYDSEFIKCTLWEGLAQSTCEYCTKGDIIGIRGRLSVRNEEIQFECDNTVHKKKINNLSVIVERVAFISVGNKTKVESPYQEVEG